MKRHFIVLSAVIMLIGSIVCTGCGSNGDTSGAGLMALMSLGGNNVSGSSANIASAGSAVTGITGTLATFQSQVTGTGGGSPSIMKDVISGKVMPGVKTRVAKSLAAISTGCDGTSEPINTAFDSEYTEDGLTVEPDLTITGTSRCTTNADGSTTTRYVLNLGGSITSAFAGKKICVFDVEDFVTNNNFNFVEHTLTGTVTVDTIDDSADMSITSNSTTVGAVETTTMSMSSSGKSSSHAVSTGLSVDGGAAVSFDLNISDSSSSDMSISMSYNSDTKTSTFGPETSSGSAAHSITGVVNGEAVSISYRFNSGDYRQYQDAYNTTSCTAMGSISCKIDGAEQNFRVGMIMESTSAYAIIGTDPQSDLSNLQSITLCLGNAAVGAHNQSSYLSNEYINYIYTVDSTIYWVYGLTEDGGSSAITVTVNDSSKIEGTFSGTLCDDKKANCKVISEGVFSAKKGLVL